MQELLNSMKSLQQAVEVMTKIIPNEVKVKMTNEMHDLNSILGAVKNNDMDKLTELKDKYADKSNK